MPAGWLTTMYFAVVHGADEHAAGHSMSRGRALKLLKASLIDLFCARP